MEEETILLQPGEKLRKAREAHELSVADVSAYLKLSAEKILALEEGNIEGFAAPVFIAGYLRAYAKLLELSEDEVLDDFAHLIAEPESVVEVPQNDEVKTYGKVAGPVTGRLSAREGVSTHHAFVIGLAVVVGLIFFLWPSSENKLRRMSEKTAQTIKSDANPVVVSESPGTIEEDRKEIKDATEITESAQQGMRTDSAEEDDAISEPPEQTSEAEPIATFDALAVGMKSELTLVFTEDSWVEVTDARDQRLEYRLGKAGSTRAVTGVAPFVVQLGYVPGVSIFYNGEAYDLSPYANRRSVRLRIGEAGDRMGGG